MTPVDENRTERVDRLDGVHAWHPFTQMSEHRAHPRLFIERGEGCWLYDTEGNRYLDGNASIWTNVHGHNDPDLNAALVGQLERIAHSTTLGLAHPTGTRLSEKLASIAPEGLQRVFYSDNGSNAVEIALKLSFQYWQLAGQPEKTGVIALNGAYHGDTFGTMSVGDSGGFHGRFSPWCFPADRVPAPVCDEAGGIVHASDMSASLARLDELLAEKAATTACLIMEPWVQGSAGMRLQPRGFLKEVAARCRRAGVHLILDEVFVGFGRVGPMLVCREEGVEPDFLCLAKGLTAGYLPLAATLTTEAVFEAFLGRFEEYKAFYHGHTFTGNPLGAAVAHKSIEKIEARMADGRHAETLAAFEAAVLNYGLGSGLFPVVRQRGLLAALELPARPVAERTGLKVALEARKHGLIARALGDTLLVVPPLVISSDEIEFLFQQLTRATQIVLNASPSPTGA
ncbi:adenosylmethionine--8-amino-7-oxononanoate transaminase [Ruficoccus amylovorans]|uniref:Adenosylmethionine-8-amino-7-oxononanoate aminotransferase n=1 Tax=Ruficoccus amylovorans TaxID=1804625 RepID=A0A842HE66_9BACT|nr:adenosylmethionine--8-amino-7-oxononanoate transaminase [Ruficoccus amylovorans]MBC2593631.1 adenosylmethionine--8-amino-7-oxononanoate transaminase [Ruficoccus amylovorans]